MAEIEVIAKRWGSSFGVIIPKDIVDQEHITVNKKIKIEIKKTRTAKEIWGLFSNLKINAQKAKNEMRKGWD